MAEMKSKWELIETTLLQDIKSSKELEKAILTYNLEDGKKWKFNMMHTLFQVIISNSLFKASKIFSIKLVLPKRTFGNICIDI